MTNWTCTIKIKHLLSDSDDQSAANGIGKEVFKILDDYGEELELNSSSFWNMVNSFNSINTVEDWLCLCEDDESWADTPPITEFNYALQELYDWADSNNVWIG